MCRRLPSSPSSAPRRGKHRIRSNHMMLLTQFHQRWNGKFFDNDSLQNLGLVYQLGHSGRACPCPLAGPKQFVVFDITGPHLVTFNYCDCREKRLSNWTQLLRERWFPATLTRPQTVFTFDCLEHFHELTLQGKTNLYDYYHTLLRRADNANIRLSIVSHYCFFFLLTESYFLSEPILRNSPCFQNVEEPDGPQASWSGSRPRRY